MKRKFNGEYANKLIRVLNTEIKGNDFEIAESE